MVAAACGALSEPELGEPPPLEPAQRWTILRWLLDGAGSRPGAPPAELIDAQVANIDEDSPPVGSAFDPTVHGLIPVLTGFPDTPTLMVVGDTAEDFAAALAWDRIFGRGIWIPADCSPAGNSSDAATMRLMYHALVVSPTLHRSGKVLVGTVSASQNAVDQIVAALREPGIVVGDESEQRRRHTEGLVPFAINFDRAGSLHWAVAEQFDQQYALPVDRDDDGGASMVAPPPAPVITHPDLSRCESLRWQVDVRMWPSSMPRGRGLDGRNLLAPGEDEYLTWVRSGRDGISYESERYNFVLAGTARVSRLARPRLREPGLREWASLMAIQQGKAFVLSDAGRRVEILRRLWDGREQLAADMAGNLLPMFRGFVVSERMTRDAYPDGDGVVLNNDGYLTFAGMARSTGPEQDLAGLRHDADRLLARRVLRRGLILDCGECGRPTFHDVNELAQVNTCPRCGAGNELSQARWREPADEPEWYYDLHPAVRELIKQHGEVPLLLSHYLRERSRRYADVPELELYENNKRTAEVDLVASADDVLVTAEAKINGTLGGTPRGARRAAAKRVAIAALLQADQIVLATTEPGWTAASLSEIRDAVSGRTWIGGREPSIRVVTGLGTPDTIDQRLQTGSGELTAW
jgi:hypothetical protein